MATLITGWPGVIAYGVSRYSGGRDFAAVRSKRPAVRIDLDGSSPFGRVLMTIDDPAAWVAVIREAAQAARAKTADA